MSNDLKQKTVSGMIWSAVQKFGNMGISFISNIILARMLTPDDYGCIGMLAIFITVSNTFVDGGFGSALIQKKEPTPKDYSTIFWWNLFISSLLYVVLFISAPFIAEFYHMPLLSSVLRVQGIILIINSLNIIQTNQLRKQLKFKRLANVTIIAQIISALTAVILAWKGWGVWALVAQQIISCSVISLILWCINKWMPNFCFSKESFNQLFRFGSFILCSNLINTFCNNVQGLLIGRFFSPAIMGYYTQAHKLETIASHSITGIVDQVTYPLLANFQNDNLLMKKVLSKLISVLVFITFPLMFILILIAEPLIFLLYGEKWAPSIIYFQILCVSGLTACFQSVYHYAIASKGESKVLFIWTIIKRTLGLLFLMLGMYLWEMKGLIWGFVLTSWLITFINAFLVSKYIKYTFIQQFKDLFPHSFLAFVSYVISSITYSCFEYNIYSKGLMCLLIYIIIFISISFILKLKVIYSFKEIVNLYFKKNK